MVLSEEDRILIKNLYHFKDYGAKRLISEFPAKGWKKTTKMICKSLVAEGQEQFKQWRISAQSITLFSVRKTHLRHIVQHDRLRENGYPSFNCCTNNSIWVTSEMRQETPCTGADWGQLHHLFESREEVKVLSISSSLQWEGIYSCTACEPPEWPCLRAVWDEEARHCCWLSTSHSADVQQVCHGVCCSLKTGMHWTDLCGAGSEGRWCILLKCSAIAPDSSCNPTSARRCVCVPAG